MLGVGSVGFMDFIGLLKFAELWLFDFNSRIVGSLDVWKRI